MIGGAASGLMLCLLGAVLARRDLRSLIRRRRWRRAEGRIAFRPTGAFPSWRIDFTLPDGRPVGVITSDLRMVARREGEGPVTLLYDPAAPERVELPRRPGIGLAVGLGLAGLGVAALLR